LHKGPSRNKAHGWYLRVSLKAGNPKLERLNGV
jgi:hypothetical protein